ncbi:MAG: hypothetical protein Q4D62_13495 [Planctomycetia bacterium]|nr:hypothetical protein [Planctomycetia bacterium]
MSASPVPPTTYRVTITLAVIACLFSAYRLFLLPILEPPMQRGASGEQDSSEVAENNRFSHFFPAGSWELHPDNIVIETEELTLIFQDYENEKGEIIRGKPCSILFYPQVASRKEISPTDWERPQNPVIVSIPDGVEIRMDAPMTSQSMGRPVWGKMHGSVTVQWKGEKETPDDDLFIGTRDVVYENGTIKSDQIVEFRYGQHVGRGNDFLIQLDFQSQDEKTPDFTGIRSLELRHLSFLRMILEKAMFPGISPQVGALFHANGTLPVELTCQGSLFFDVPNEKVLFQENVLIQCRYATGLRDSLMCDTLLLNFAATPPEMEENVPVSTPQNASRMALQEVIASGREVLLTSNQFFLQARGTSLEIDVHHPSIRLEDTRETTLRHQNLEFHGNSIEYHFSEKSGELGSVLVSGPGWMQYRLESQKPENSDILRASWRTELRTYPDENEEYAILLTGRATVDSQRLGKLSADSLSIWLKKVAAGQKEVQETPSQDLFGNYVPARLLASENVVFQFLWQKNCLSGNLTSIELWFQSVAQLPTGVSPGTENVAAGESTAPPVAAATTTSKTAEEHQFQLQAKTLRGNLLLAPGGIYLSEMVLSEGIRLSEEIAYETSDTPIFVSANQLRFSDITPQTLQGQIIGEPAVLRGRGLELSGSAINVNCAANRAWMDCPGEIRFFLRKRLPSEMLDIPETMVIVWEGNLTFDGQRLDIRKNVRVRHPLHAMDAQQIQATLGEKISFSRPPRMQPSQESLQVVDMTASGNILTESIVQKEGKNVANVKVGAHQASFNPTTGDLAVAGRGWIQSTFLHTRSSPLPGEKEKNPAEKKEPTLFHLNISFTGGASGNTQQQEIRLHEGVQVVGDEVADWGTTISPNIDPIYLGERGFLLHAEEMQINEDPMLMDNQTQALEFLAEKNVRIEMRNLTARAHRLSYSTAKDLIILTGGRNRVQVNYQKNIGSPRRNLEAQRIEYHPSTREIKSEDLIMKDAI